MNVSGTNINPTGDDLPKVDVIANQIAQVQANLETLNEVRNKRIQITNQKDRDNIEEGIKELNEELAKPIWDSQMIRQGAEVAVVHEYRAELRGRIAVLKSLVKSDEGLKDQITETENVLKKLLKQQSEK